MPIPEFGDDGLLPAGIHDATADEVVTRYGSQNDRRRILTSRLLRWIELGRIVGASRLLVAGSYVTAKDHPGDVDVVMALPGDIQEQLVQRRAAALELSRMIEDREPAELFAAGNF